MTTIKDIAKLANVSPATVSYVINDTRPVSPEKKERILKAIKELNYVPNAVARGLRTKKSKTIGLVISDITNPFYPDLAKSCEDVARLKDYNLVIMNTNEQYDKMRSVLFQLKEGKVDGLIVACAKFQDFQLLSEIVQLGFPLVLAHRKLPGLKVDSVVCDNFNGAVSAVRHFLSLGHRKIAFINGITDSYVNTERLNGYKKAMADAGIEVLPEWIESGQVRYHSSYNATLKLMKLPKDIRPTAILAASDIPALAVLDAALDLNLKVPDDLAVIGFDDLFFAESRAIQLTTIRIPRYEIGQQVTRVLIDLMEKKNNTIPNEYVLPTKLIIRKTCGALGGRSNSNFSSI